MRMLLNIAKQNIPSMFFSYEMSKRQLVERAISMESSVNLLNIRNGTINDDELEEVKSTFQTIGNYPIYIDSDMNAPLSYVISTIRKQVSKSGIQL